MNISLGELNLYINLLESTLNKNYNDYDEIIKDLKYEFNVNTNELELDALYNPDVYEESEDVYYKIKNIFLV